jgi:hypothetical protein
MKTSLGLCDENVTLAGIMINPRALCVLALLLAIPLSVFSQPANGITREVYANIGGSALSDLTNNPAFPNSPTTEDVLTTSIDCPVNYLDNYGTRLRALIVPPTTGPYTFWISSDDQSALYLSTDSAPANKQLIARVNTWTSWKEWTKETNQQSAPINLVAGQQYYFEALQKEGQGGDSLTVRWQLPGGAFEEPIPASRCIPVGVSAPLFSLQPANAIVVEGNQASFNVRITRSFGAVLQWQRNNTNIPDANGTNYTLAPVTLGDNDSTFRCIATNPYGSTTSSVATLSVLADTTPPTVSSVGNLGDNDVITVVFTEPVEVASATNPTNYGINNGVTILSASMGVDSRTVVLTTMPMQVNVTYTLTVNNVRDRATTPNPIAPNTQRTFSISPRPLDMFFVKPQAEPIGASTRRGPFVISEVMYHPTNRLDGRNLEFIEVHNSNPWPEEMGGFRISGAIDYTFPSNFVLGARSFAVLAAVPADIQAVYGIGGVLGPWTGTLQNSDGTLRIRNAVGAVMFEMDYTGEPPFPASADGAGHSLVLARPTFGERDARAWAASEMIGGTPGANQIVTANPLRMIFINEFLAHTDLPDLDYIELYNYSSAAVNIGGCVLTDNADTNKFIIPTNTMIPANGFITFYETNLGFALSAEGETIYLKNPQNTRVLDAVRFEAQENGVSMGRSPDGAPEFYRLASSTPGAGNSRQRPPTVVINELMYHPLTEDDADEYIELRNVTTNAMNVGKWRIKDAVKFTLPDTAIIPPNGYLVVAANAARLRANYPGLNVNNCVGDWEGSLRNSGERVALTMPDQIISTNILGQPVTNTIHIVMDEVSYRDGGRWGSLSDGNGSSLELRDWRNDRRLSPSWVDSDETFKSGWTNIEATGVMDNGWENATQLHITLMGAGEVLIDNVEVIHTGFGTNLIGNPGFETGTSGWVFQGNHNTTSWETSEGFGSARSLHLRASGRGDHGANRVRTQLPFTLASGTTVTLRAKVRWLKGNPNIHLRLRGNYFEAPGFTLTARNLGTPGAPNSAAVTNSAPAITDVAHWPPLPANNQQVLVTARASDADGLATLLLRYRIDPNTNYTSLAMTNNGGGLFSAVIPGQANVAAAFYIQAADRLQPALGSTFPNDAPARECVVRWGDTNVIGTLGTYRFWLTQRTIDQWANEEKMSNKGKDVTFIYGTNRVVYNANAWFHGSPYHSPSYNSPVGNSCDYDMNFPTDDRFLGETDINLFRPGNGGGDGTAQAEIHAYWFGGQFGVPFLYHRPVFLFVNGLRRDTVFHDAQQPNGDFVEQWFPDDAEGELHKIQLGFEFGDTAYGAGEAGYSAIGANFARYTTTGGAFKLARYRATLPWRSASPYQQNNYTSVYNLVNATLTTSAINTPAYTTVLTNMFDVREWFKVHVAQHLYNNTDSFSYGGGQNAFMYKPTQDRWKLFLWDVDFAFNGNGSDANLTGIGGADHGPRNDHAPFTRIYWQALIEAANGMMTPARSDTILDARYNGMNGAGASVGSPANIKNFIVQKRAVILGMLSTNNTSPFEVLSNGGTNYSVSNNLVTLTGRAPYEVAAIEVNGVIYDVTWTTRTNWSLQLALPSGTNALNILTYDSNGRLLTNFTDTISINVTAPPAPPQDFIVINEIMFAPTTPDAEYVELFNTSTNVSFDLSNWRFDGLSYVFPEGTIMPPRAFMLLAKDRLAFAAAYGTNIVPYDVFAGNLQANGETLTLVKPGATPAQDTVIDKVRYDGALPWPYGLPPATAAVQLIDAKQENARVGNWYGLSPLSTNSPWRFVSTNGLCNTATPQLLMYLSETGSLYIDDISFVVGTVPAVGQNLVRNGDFESTFYEDPAVTNSWIAGTNYTNSAISTAFAHSGNSSLKIVCTAFGNTISPLRLIYQALSPYPTNGTICTLSYWYLPTTNATNVNIRIRNNSALNTVVNVRPQAQSGPAFFTPGTNNSVATSITPFPNLWINEVQAKNTIGITDAFGEREPWIEIYNPGTNAVPLDGLYLSSNYMNLALWAFPTGAVIQPGEFKIIFADGEPNETTNSELHTNFRLPAGSGSVALSRPYGQDIQVLDYVNYIAGANHSYGSFPDGQPFTRFEMYFVTAGATNNGTLPPLNVFINEWMADNVGALADSADGNYEDWFELYNPGDAPVSLGGYYLTDVLANKFKYQIPPGYSIPAQGYLLVWADGETGQNSPGNPELHANFSLSKDGEAIGLFTPDGLEVDAVTFGGQQSDIAQGRFPDGNETIYSLTNYTPTAQNYYPQPNAAPQIAPIGNRNVFEGALLTFNVVASDPNLPGQQLTWSLLPGAPVGAGIGASDGVFAWIPSEAQGGSSYFISVVVSDNGVPSLSATQSFKATVMKTNNAPSLVIPGDGQVNEGDVFSFTAVASDPDVPAQPLTFSLDPSGLPAGAAINPTNGLFTWQPAENHGGEAFAVTVRVADNGTPPLTNSAAIVIRVNESNAPPALASLTNRAALLGEAVSFTVTATDPDQPAQVLAFDFASAVPAGATINATNGQFSWTANNVGTNTFLVRATDNGSPAMSDTKTFDIVVTASLQITSIAVSNEVVSLVWSANPGRSYSVEYKNSLSQVDWMPLATNILATNSAAAVNDLIGTNTQRIYRIVLEP